MKIKLSLISSLFVFGLMMSLAVAATIETPTALKGAEVIDATKAKSLIDSGIKLIDTRIAIEFAEAHIKGASNVPYKEKSAKAVDFDAAQDTFDLAKLPGDKNAGIIFQCNGPECWKSYKAAIAAQKNGYKKIYWFRGGFPEWKSKGYPTE